MRKTGRKLLLLPSVRRRLVAASYKVPADHWPGGSRRPMGQLGTPCGGSTARLRNGQRGERIMAYDLLIKNGRVVDGSGEPAFQAGVAVHQGKIVGVGQYKGRDAERVRE